MKTHQIEKNEIFGLLTFKQVDAIHDAAQIKSFEPGQIVYEHKEQAHNVYFLLEGEVALKIPSQKDTSIKQFSLEIDVIKDKGVFGANQLFGIQRYMARARVTKPSKILKINTDDFLKIIKENHSEFYIMSYLAKVYFLRYNHTMKEYQQFAEKQTGAV